MTQDAEHITLAHGNGGRFMRELVRDVFARHFGGIALDTAADGATLPRPGGRLVFTTDSFIVDPLEFPGGDIGSLAVHRTVNDLAVSGATPRLLSLGFLIEEGFSVRRLDRIAASIGRAAQACGIDVVAGDTKVLPRGQGGSLYLAASGIGTLDAGVALGAGQVRPGDRLLVSGPVGDHGTAILLTRNEFGLSGDLRSDCASVLPFTRAALAGEGVRFMRDPTRGGIATVAHEIALATGHRIVLDETSLPVGEQRHPRDRLSWRLVDPSGGRGGATDRAADRGSRRASHPGRRSRGHGARAAGTAQPHAPRRPCRVPQAHGPRRRMTAETLGEMLQRRGFGRRSLLKFAIAMTSSLALPPALAPVMAANLARAKRRSVIWPSFP